MAGQKKRSERTASLKHENHFFNEGCHYIFGFDEVGRGPWAGPVAAGAVCLPLELKNLSQLLRGVKDSKQMTAPQREQLAEVIKKNALAWGVGHVDAATISTRGINWATKQAMSNALNMALLDKTFTPDCLFLDYMLWPERRDIPQVSIVGGDRYSLSIAAASVLAKVWRDAYMDELHLQYPEYGFADHKGYGTAQHRIALEAHGVTPVHRTNYAPIQALLDE